MDLLPPPEAAKDRRTGFFNHTFVLWGRAWALFGFRVPAPASIEFRAWALQGFGFSAGLCPCIPMSKAFAAQLQTANPRVTVGFSDFSGWGFAVILGV